MIELYTHDRATALRVAHGTRARDHFIKHAYRCQPLLDANAFGWDLMSQQDIVIENRQPVAGPGYLQFGMDTFTLDVGYRWRTSADLLVMPVPNQTETAWHAMTALIDTRACPYPWFLTIRMVEPTFRIPAGTPLCRAIPVNRHALAQPQSRPIPPDIEDMERQWREDRRAVYPKEHRNYHSQASIIVTPKPVRLDAGCVIRTFIDRDECHRLIVA